MVTPFLIQDTSIIKEDNDFLLQNIEADRKLQKYHSPAKSVKSSAISAIAEVKKFCSLAAMANPLFCVACANDFPVNWLYPGHIPTHKCCQCGGYVGFMSVI
jgi:hypothetical protein